MRIRIMTLIAASLAAAVGCTSAPKKAEPAQPKVLVVYYSQSNTTRTVAQEIQKQLKLRSAETGKSQLELANQYILEGLRNNKPSNLSLDEIDGLPYGLSPKEMCMLIVWRLNRNIYRMI